ncbi:hypothetical protein BDB00DRAFT_767131 [Zychaea mexicana]|uniref:uncharacterized protein n=1 Tax=Zychaea mexicana TaxID=64656 RepID=UPI0022FDCBDB|nr:uncharacterized protein BDB00DRAFT_767131 [Zychaea mexicana]KAI9491360.1 hypothetical protein BDB00DRAFT_767131 [Zychaea mexicana]
MGCCMSAEKSKVYEVVLDHNGVARRVPSGQGTHLIYESQFKETRMEQKSDVRTISRHTAVLLVFD